MIILDLELMMMYTYRKGLRPARKWEIIFTDTWLQLNPARSPFTVVSTRMRWSLTSFKMFDSEASQN